MDIRHVVIIVVLFTLFVAMGAVLGQRYNKVDVASLPAPIVPEGVIVSEPETVPEEFREFLGSWEGVWNERSSDYALRSIIIVKDVNENGIAQVSYAVGDHEGFEFAGRYFELEGQIHGGEFLSVNLDNPSIPQITQGGSLIFEKEGDVLHGMYRIYDSVSGGEFRKQL